MKYRPALTENSTLVDTQFLSTHSAKSHSAERRVQFPSFVGSVLPLGNPQCLVFVSFPHQKGRHSSSLLYIYFCVSLGNPSMYEYMLYTVTLDSQAIHQFVDSYVCRTNDHPTLLLRSVSLVQALL